MPTSQTPPDVRVGPVLLAPGVSRLNFWAYLHAAFACIAVMAGMNFLQSYVLTEHLQLPRDVQGAVSGDLVFWTEIVAIILIGPFGALCDRIGRKPVIVAGILAAGVGYGLYPLATSVPELVAFRMLYAVGAAALGAVLAIIGNDYPAEASRGRMIGVAGFMNGLGVIFMSALVARIPAWLTPQGIEPITAGRMMFWSVALLCLVSALVFARGLRSGTPLGTQHRPGWSVLLLSGMRAAANPRIVLSYAAAFTGRSDVAIKGIFISLWALVAAPEAGLDSAEALKRAGIVLAFTGVISLVWNPLFGVVLDRVDRVTGLALAMGLAGVGYGSMAFITSPLDFSMLPAFAVLAAGQSSAIVASITLVGQEAPARERGAVIGMNGLCGAIGILISAVVGGRLFDAWGPWAPFVLLGGLQLVICAAAIAVRVSQIRRAGAPGRDRATA